MPQNKLQPLPKTANFSEFEERILAFWKKDNTFQKSVDQRDTKKSYVFYDGPPFATGLPHHGHLLGSTTKDVIPRYWTMKGYRVERIWGWDCHGLPIETMIQKKLGISGQLTDIEAFGIDKFNAACRAEVLKLDTQWEKIIDRLGRWVDFENNYKTMDTSFMESVWWGFQTMWEKGLIYEGKRVIMYSPSSMTPLSNFEIAMDNSYKEITEPATTYKYKLRELENTYLLAWSTTPWNKIATPALAVHPTLEYSVVKQGGESYIVVSSRLEAVLEGEYTLERTLTGQELTQFTFEAHYDFYAHERTDEKFEVIVADEFVTDTEGTGVVTLAVYGEDDYRVMQREDIQLVEHVDMTGTVMPEVTPWAGKYYLGVNKKVDADLTQRGLVYKQEQYTHSVPLDYRTGERVYYAPVPAWFVDVQQLKDQLILENEAINWFPEHLKHGRFGKGLENAPDWNISRSRFWGTPMPIWKSEDGEHMRIIGSIAELKKWAVDANKAAKVTDIHREHLDDLELWVDDDKTIKGTRISEVFDCWVESGSMPFASKHYPFENKESFERDYPAQFISEYIAQTRAWFYTMHVISNAVFGKKAYENVLTTGTYMAADGNKLSKSKKNYTDPMELISEYGADSFRLYMMSTTVMKSESVSFKDREILDIKRNVFNIWWNTLKFYRLYAAQNPHDLTAKISTDNVLDKWIMSRLHNTTKDVTMYMDNYNVIKASRTLMDFVSELSTWYLRRSRDRLRDDTLNADALVVFGRVLATLSQLFAPLTPFFAEFSYQAVVGEGESVHLTDWPQYDESLIHPQLEEKMSLARKAVESIHAARKQAQLKVRQPLAKVTIIAPSSAPKQNLLDVIAAEVNVKVVEWQHGTEELQIKLDTLLTPELEAEGQARELIRSIQKLRKEAGMVRDEAIAVTAPQWPEKWQAEIEEKTGSTLRKGSELAIEAV